MEANKYGHCLSKKKKFLSKKTSDTQLLEL